MNLVCHAFILQRSTGAGAREDKADVDFANNFTEDTHLKEKEPSQSSTNLVFGYLNLFSDGVVCVPYYLFSSFFLINICKYEEEIMDSHNTVLLVNIAAQFY